MPSAFDRVDFAPPAQPGLARGMGMAIFAHVLLLAALTWGVNWKRQTTTATAQAELWSSIPQQAAPRAVAPPPPPAPPPKPEPKPAPAPPPVEKAPDIVEKPDKPPKKPAEKPAEKPPEPKPKPEVKPAADPAALKKEAQKKAAEEAAEREKDRQDAINRASKLAGSGAPDSPGTAAQSSGASASDGVAIANIIKNNTSKLLEYDDSLKSTFEIRISGSGQILSIRLLKSSGNPSWDDAALRGIERTREKGGIPPTIAARVPSTFPVNVSP